MLTAVPQSLQVLCQHKCQAKSFACKQVKTSKPLTVLITTSHSVPLAEYTTTYGFTKGIEHECDEVSGSSCWFGGTREGRRTRWTLSWISNKKNPGSRKFYRKKSSRLEWINYKGWGREEEPLIKSLKFKKKLQNQTIMSRVAYFGDYKETQESNFIKVRMVVTFVEKWVWDWDEAHCWVPGGG